MSNLIFPATAPRTHVNPLGCSMGADSWRDRVASARTGRNAYGAKQAAPPRGIPR